MVSAEATTIAAGRACRQPYDRFHGYGLGFRRGHAPRRPRVRGRREPMVFVHFVGILAAAKQTGKEAYGFAKSVTDARPSRAASSERFGWSAAAPLDVGESERIAAQRLAVRRNMHGAAIRENLDQLIVRHARPVPDGAGVHVHEGRAGGRIETDAAALQPKTNLADLLERHAGNEEVHRLAIDVLAELRDAIRARGAALNWFPASG